MQRVKSGKGMTIKARNLACFCVGCKTGGVCSEQRHVKEWCSHNVRMTNLPRMTASGRSRWTPKADTAHADAAMNGITVLQLVTWAPPDLQCNCDLGVQLTEARCQIL